MSFVDDLARRIQRGEPIPFPIGAALSAATPFVRAGMSLRLMGSRERLPARVISFGNITAGGTGKTPAVIERVQREMGAGRRVAVLTRGYGSEHRRSATLVDTRGRRATDEWLGDEPELIALRAPGVVIAKGSDRVSGGRQAIQALGCDTLILDDGYQHVRLERDENVVVIDATNPFGNGRLLPRGILREPLPALSRATHVILTRCDQAPDLDAILSVLALYCSNAPVRKTRHAPARLWRVADAEPLPIEALRGTKVKAVCAIGRPEAFVGTLESLGANVTAQAAYRDHASIPAEAMAGDMTVVVTEKDAVRLKDAPANVLALGVDLQDL